MSTVGTHAWTRVETAAPPGATAALRAEWVKFWTVRVPASPPWCAP
jgi:ABC-2 type transport system permease protein